jgi:hypothetical protein
LPLLWVARKGRRVQTPAAARYFTGCTSGWPFSTT